MIKRYFIGLLLMVYFLSITQLSELLKIPILIEHYSEHLQENKAMSFLDFLSIHYSRGSVKDADYERDRQLPFKSVGIFSSLTACIQTPLHSFNLKPLVYPQVKSLSPNTNGFLYVSDFHSFIWQPPKVA